MLIFVKKILWSKLLRWKFKHNNNVENTINDIAYRYVQDSADWLHPEECRSTFLSRSYRISYCIFCRSYQRTWLRYFPDRACHWIVISYLLFFNTRATKMIYLHIILIPFRLKIKKYSTKLQYEIIPKIWKIAILNYKIFYISFPK